MALLELQDLSKFYEQPAVDNINLSLEQGRILCLLGPSGCGKTTLLRLVAGLEQPDQGRVVYDGRNITSVPPHRRQFGLMFQEFALFPHKNVFDNVAFGLQIQQQIRSKIRQRTEEMLALVGLSGLAGRNVGDLSGGERQRVALARSLAPQPRLLMLDEPLGALDRALRERLMHEIRDILKSLAMTAIFVTHDQSEALAVADTIAVMNRGRLEQVDRPEELYLKPQCVFVARFLGFHNLISGLTAPDNGVQTELGLWYPSEVKVEPGQRVHLVLRPEAAEFPAGPLLEDHRPRVTGRIVSRVFAGRCYRLGIKTDSEVELLFDLPNDTPPPPKGDRIKLALRPSHMVIIKNDEPANFSGTGRVYK